MIAKKGEIVYSNNFGYRTIDKKIAYEKDAIFRLASMTKAFTTVSIMQLYDKGLLKLDDSIAKFIPAFEKAVVLKDFYEKDSSFTTVPAKKQITIRNLLTHTSGLTYGSSSSEVGAIYTKLGIANFGLFDAETTTEQMVDRIAKVPLLFEPGTKYSYGISMDVLGRVIEVISKKTLSEYFKENIFTPLGMKDTHFYLPKEKHSRLVPVYSYNENKEMIMGEDTPFGVFLEYPKKEDKLHYAGGGGTSGTGTDYLIFTQALLNKGIYNGKRIVSEKAIKEITTDQMVLINKKGNGFSKISGFTYGLGFSLLTEEARGISKKSPGTFEWGGYFNTKFFIDPEQELVFVGLTQIVSFHHPDFWDKMINIIYESTED